MFHTQLNIYDNFHNVNYNINIDKYFLTSQDKIPRKENKNPAKMSGLEASVSMPDSTQEEEEQQQVQANTIVVLVVTLFLK